MTPNKEPAFTASEKTVGVRISSSHFGALEPHISLSSLVVTSHI